MRCCTALLMLFLTCCTLTACESGRPGDVDAASVKPSQVDQDQAKLQQALTS